MWQWQGLQLQAPAHGPEVHRLSSTSSSSTAAATMDGLASSSGTPLAGATPAPSGSLGPDLLLGSRSPFEALVAPGAACHLTLAQQQQAAALQQLQAANERSTAGNAPAIQQTLLQLSKMLGVDLPGSPGVCHLPFPAFHPCVPLPPVGATYSPSRLFSRPHATIDMCYTCHITCPECWCCIEAKLCVFL
jgi:hypothetical protein